MEPPQWSILEEQEMNLNVYRKRNIYFVLQLFQPQHSTKLSKLHKYNAGDANGIWLKNNFRISILILNKQKLYQMFLVNLKKDFPKKSMKT